MIREEEAYPARRRFLKTAIAGGLSTVAAGLLWKNAAALVTGQRAVHGVGIEDPELVQLSINENPLGASQRAIEAVAHKLFALNRYPPREPVLHEAIARYHGNGITWEMVANGVGSTEILKTIGLVAMLDGKGSVEPEPGYGAISGVASDLKRPAVRVPVTMNLQTDLEAVRKAITKDTGIVCLTNPNNPTGQLLPHEDLARFLKAVPENIIVCMDEAYIHFSDDEHYASMVPLTKNHPNLLVSRTMSKAFGLGGIRVGYGIADPKLIERMKPHLLGWLGRNILSDVAAIAALEDQEHIRKVHAHVLKEKAYLYDTLTSMGLKPVKTQTIFVLVDMGKDAQPLVDALKAKKVLIRRASGMPNYLRISVGTRIENEVFIETFKEVLGKAGV
ncbi:MAG: histidinol-phosphate aminotransferase family protein [candidate division Zixibacteria bacterium]|nr:histidinol-phosphate aminotransferase family protein [candidate division Zixibacteria bacterium]